ncbi:MAG TPA: hypothetical protein VK668_22815 [Mucilaginibacter sp.]|nr:hypothetical protein [Mucilaginibacter sp.]
MKTTLPGKTHLAGVLFLLVLSSCGVRKVDQPSHAQVSKPRESRKSINDGESVETNLYQGDFKLASAKIDNNPFLLKDRNKLLYLLEKGKIEYLAGNNSKSNDYFEQAYMLVDDKIKTSVGQGIAAKLTNPMAEPYKGEDFEKVTLHYYKALNYFQMGQPNEALVEAKRINIKLFQLNYKYKDNKNKYAADAFSQIVQGIIYESLGDMNNAFIAYRNAEELYEGNSDQYFGVPLPNQLKLDLIRTAKQMNFVEEMSQYQTKFGIVGSSEPQNVPRVDSLAKVGEVVLFWENGLGPVKGQTKITVGGAPGVTATAVSSSPDEYEPIIIIPTGVNIGLTSIAIPKYIPRESYYNKASILTNGEEHFFELSEDYNIIAKQCLKDRMQREVLDIALRVGAKKVAGKGLSMLASHFLGDAAGKITSLATDVVSVATEKADLRNWQSLPANISYVRLPLRQGDNSFVIKKYGINGIDHDTIHIMGKPGLQVISYFDLGRTISN